jgi:hypothetical protein
MALVCASLLLPSSGAEAAPRVLARETAFGDFAVAYAEVDIEHPRTLYIKLKARPNQEVKASWRLTCTGEEISGWERGRQRDVTPFRWRIRMHFGEPDRCNIRARARLLGAGAWVRLILLEARS